MPVRVVIIGGGFAGLAAAKVLDDPRFDVTVIDRQNHHLFQPLLYQVATASLAPSDIAEPIRYILRDQRNVHVKLGSVDEIDLQGRRVRHHSGEWLPYDKLLLCTGVTHSYFGRDEWAQHAPGLKSIDDALEIRQKMLHAFEEAEWCEGDLQRRQRLMTFVVIGAGPTGVEMAGAIAELACRTLRPEFRKIDTAASKVLLIEAGDAVLAAYPPGLQKKAAQALEDLGVTIRLKTKVTGVDAQGVMLGEERLDSATMVWAAGVAGSPLARQLGVPLDRAGRVPVKDDCSIEGHPEVFVCGDLAAFTQDGKVLPGLAPVAQAHGKQVAWNLIYELNGGKREKIRYFDKGTMATIGRSKAVALGPGGRFPMSGLIAWLGWVFIHLVFLVGFRNRALVFLKWTWAWFTYDRASRLIWHEDFTK